MSRTDGERPTRRGTNTALYVKHLKKQACLKIIWCSWHGSRVWTMRHPPDKRPAGANRMLTTIPPCFVGHVDNRIVQAEVVPCRPGCRIHLPSVDTEENRLSHNGWWPCRGCTGFVSIQSAEPSFWCIAPGVAGVVERNWTGGPEGLSPISCLFSRFTFAPPALKLSLDYFVSPLGRHFHEGVSLSFRSWRHRHLVGPASSRAISVACPAGSRPDIRPHVGHGLSDLRLLVKRRRIPDDPASTACMSDAIGL